MSNTSRGRRLALLAGLVGLCVWSVDAGAGATPATKERCTRYAKRAVEQYRLMLSHPECEVKNDPLTWQDSYDNHYNGCLIFPEAMAKLGEQARDNHLQACGALSDSAAAPALAANKAAAGKTAVGAAPATAIRPASSAPSAQPAATSAAAGAPADCRTQRPSALPNAETKVGFGAALSNGTLSFHSVPRQGELQSYGVMRPAYISRQLTCTGRADDRYGPWVTLIGESGAELFMVGADDAVFSAPLTPEAAQQLLTR